MTRPKLHDRILAALALAPMTDAELARCLCTAKTYVEGVRGKMLRRGLIRVCGYGTQHRKGGIRPHAYAPAERAA